MINFSLNTCWRLIPTEGDNRRNSVVAFSVPTTNLVVNLRELLGGFKDNSHTILIESLLFHTSYL